jgi:hypothetical protein
VFRASDRDRNQVADELRTYCADGRITVEELERRREQAMTAQTIHELAVVVTISRHGACLSKRRAIARVSARPGSVPSPAGSSYPCP